MEAPENKVVLSGIQPSGVLHLGNYLGALKQWVALQENNQVYYCIVDQHAITVDYEPDKLQEKILDMVAGLLAVGLDADKSVLFVQSQVPAHTELAWLLATQTPMGELERMTQFKDKAKGQERASVGLFAYPVLQAADILLYQPKIVPVGEDQTQHLELTRDIAKRFNNKFGEAFTLPKAFVPEEGARVMSLQDPAKKMSKSDAEKTFIALTDEEETIRKKISSAVTDTEAAFSFKDAGPAVKNLLGIYKALSEESEEEIEKRFIDAGYKEFKENLADLVVEKLAPIREKYLELRQDEDELRVLVARGAGQARQVAQQTLHDAKDKMGLI